MGNLETLGERIFHRLNYILLALISLLTVYPFIYVLAASLSNPEAVINGNVWFIPSGFELNSYQKVVSQAGIWIAYANTIIYSSVGTIVNILITMLGAYPLSKKRLRGGRFILGMVLITIWFQPGMIPFYLNLRNLSLLDQRITIIIAFACSAYYVILMKTFFQSIDDSMEESARLDGANDWTILFRIFMPLSLPMLATIALYYFVDRWNSYFWAMIIFKDENKIPLQVLLKKLVVEMKASQDMASGVDMVTYSEETVIYATIIVSTIPMLIIYPFIQKYFVKGIMLGAVKG